MVCCWGLSSCSRVLSFVSCLQMQRKVKVTMCFASVSSPAARLPLLHLCSSLLCLAHPLAWLPPAWWPPRPSLAFPDTWEDAAGHALCPWAQAAGFLDVWGGGEGLVWDPTAIIPPRPVMECSGHPHQPLSISWGQLLLAASPTLPVGQACPPVSST